jgi:predicted ester cyclase
MRQHLNRALIQRFCLEMWNRFDKTIIPDMLTKDLQFRHSLGQSKSGYTEFGEYVDSVQRAFPDFSHEIEEIVSEGNKAFAKVNYRGTHRWELFGIKPTGRLVQYVGAAVFKLTGARIAKIWVLDDIYGFISQLKSTMTSPCLQSDPFLETPSAAIHVFAHSPIRQYSHHSVARWIYDA